MIKPAIIIKKILSAFYFAFKSKPKGVIENNEYKNLFFGYYDLSPFSQSENMLLLHAQKTEASKFVDILIYNIESQLFQKVGETISWTYQQGARLTWFDKNKIIYNNYDEENLRHHSLIINLETKEKMKIPFPLQALHKQDFMISINYYHLYEVESEYGYRFRDENNKKTVIKYNFKTNDFKELFNFCDCERLLKCKYVDTSCTHFNHFLISPDGDYFIFVYRFYCKGMRVDNLFGYSISMNRLDLLIENELISHCTWQNNTSFLFWGKINSKTGYFLFGLDEKNYTLILQTPKDGHPSFINQDLIITDTYPNKFLRQQLFTYNLKTKVKNILMQQKHPSNYSSYERCDLHPSISQSGKLYQVDIILDGDRKVCVGKI
jgi:hypothetical protein